MTWSYSELWLIALLLFKLDLFVSEKNIVMCHLIKGKILRNALLEIIVETLQRHLETKGIWYMIMLLYFW